MKNLLLALLVISVAACSRTSDSGFHSDDSVPIAAIETTAGLEPVAEDTAGLVEPPAEMSPEQLAIATMNELMTFELAPADKDGPTYENISNAVWTQKRGICGDRAIAMIMRMRENGIPARIVGIFGISAYGVDCHASHAACEVYFENRWHYFDPTYGVYFQAFGSSIILSFRDVLKNAYDDDLLRYGYGPIEAKRELMGFAQYHQGIVYGEEEYQEFVKYIRR